jgi:hypothetical protein
MDAPRPAVTALDSDDKLGSPVYSEATSEVIAVDRTENGLERSVRITLAPTFAIAGRVRDSNGARGGVRATVVPDGTDDRANPLRSRHVDIANDGSFRIDGIPDGRYDVLIDSTISDSFTSISPSGKAEQGSGFWIGVAPLAPVRFAGIPAGSENLDLVVEPPPRVDVSVEARPRSGSADRIVVMLGRIRSRAANARVRDEPPHDAVFRDHAGWPTEHIVFGGGSNYDDLGASDFLTLVQPGASFHWPPLAEGIYWIGLCAKDDRTDELSYTEGTGWVYLKPGAYHFAFETVATTSIEGQLRASTPDRSLCVALADDAGRLLRVKADHSTIGTIVPTGADGSFWLEDAPTGRFTLRVGSESELRDGRFRIQRTVEFGERANAPLMIDVR